MRVDVCVKIHPNGVRECTYSKCILGRFRRRFRGGSGRFRRECNCFGNSILAKDGVLRGGSGRFRAVPCVFMAQKLQPYARFHCLIHCLNFPYLFEGVCVTTVILAPGACGREVRTCSPTPISGRSGRSGAEFREAHNYCEK